MGGIQPSEVAADCCLLRVMRKTLICEKPLGSAKSDCRNYRALEGVD